MSKESLKKQIGELTADKAGELANRIKKEGINSDFGDLVALELDMLRDNYHAQLASTKATNEEICTIVHRLQGVEIARYAIFSEHDETPEDKDE